MDNAEASFSVRNVNDALLEVRLRGRYTFEAVSLSGLDLAGQLTSASRGVRIVDAGLSDWDSALLVLLRGWRKLCDARGLDLDLSGLPNGARQLIRLAEDAPEHQPPRREEPVSLPHRIGDRVLNGCAGVRDALAFVGEAAVSGGRLLTGKAHYRPAGLWLIVQQCGPQALGIVTTISVLVGAILAFVGAIQLRLFGAELFIANLVGLGMVIEMGALMTGVILAGRTGAAFAAELGTMQVNEEIDALRTLGLRPMDYLVLPRITALAAMAPLLVIYADLLGILGGAAVGTLLLGIPGRIFFSQAFEMLTPWHVAQGLIKGSTFGILIAFAGCLRGMQCGRSASAVGEAATSAVVTSIVLIVVADAIWTLVFMLME